MVNGGSIHRPPDITCSETLVSCHLTLHTMHVPTPMPLTCHPDSLALAAQDLQYGFQHIHRVRLVFGPELDNLYQTQRRIQLAPRGQFGLPRKGDFGQPLPVDRE
jgi:hypothetical protein